MRLRFLGRAAAASAAVALLGAGSARADWTITTYKQIPGNPGISSMAIADEYFTGARATRFEGTSTVPQVDLFESGGPGQFAINHPFPGLDNFPAAGDTNDYTARITGTLVVNTPGDYDFFTDSDDGNRFRLDLNQNGTFEDATESIVPDGGLQGTGVPERSGSINLAVGNYNFEVSFFEAGGGASIDAGYRVNGSDTQYVLGDATGGIGMVGEANVRAVGASIGPNITNFAQADALRTGTNAPGFPVTELRDVFNLTDSGATGDFPGDLGVPGLGAPDENDDDDFVVVGRGLLIVPDGGVSAVFRSNTDDGGRLLIDTNQNGSLGDPSDVIILQDALQGPTNTDSEPISLAAGQYLIEYTWFERGGGGEGEVSVRVGNRTGFVLLGLNQGVPSGATLEVATIPEPASAALAGMMALVLAGVARRRA